MPESAFKGTILEGKERKFTVINENDFEKYVPKGAKERLRIAFNNIAAWIEEGREKEGKNPFNSYIVINTDEPYINEIARVMKENGHLEHLEECSYCEQLATKLRPTPFMGDVPAMMCKQCWDMTKTEYEASHEEYIGEFEDYPHFDK